MPAQFGRHNNSPTPADFVHHFVHLAALAGFYGTIELWPRPQAGVCDICHDRVERGRAHVPRAGGLIWNKRNGIHEYVRESDGSALLIKVRCEKHIASIAALTRGHVAARWPD